MKPLHDMDPPGKSVFYSKICGGGPHSRFYNNFLENTEGSLTKKLTECIKPEAKGWPTIILESKGLDKTLVLEISQPQR